MQTRHRHEYIKSQKPAFCFSYRCQCGASIFTFNHHKFYTSPRVKSKLIRSAGQRAAARLENVLAEKSLTLKNSPFMGALAKTLVALYLPKQIMSEAERVRLLSQGAVEMFEKCAIDLPMLKSAKRKKKK